MHECVMSALKGNILSNTGLQRLMHIHKNFLMIVLFRSFTILAVFCYFGLLWTVWRVQTPIIGVFLFLFVSPSFCFMKVAASYLVTR